MYVRQTLLKNASGLHARPASELVARAKGFSSQVLIRNADKPDTQPVNAKSIVRLLSVGLSAGTTVEISADGLDEQEAVTQLITLINSGFGEE
ncbi:MAG: HPr family phosphocarrier protein [Clostridia bacterium]|nr:HPr family phosphocarrier protein [Clostridia bacterium]